MFRTSSFLLVSVIVVGLAFSICAGAQNVQGAELKPGKLVGTVIDVNGETVPSATVALEGPDRGDRRTVATPENGFFEFGDVRPNSSYRISVTAAGFAGWTSPAITLDPGQFRIVTGIRLRVETEHTTLDVHYDQAQVATEQFKALEQQRVFGIIPNYYVAYDSNVEPLTAKMKFKLALKVSADPVTAAGILFVAAAKQAGNSPRYGQGWGPFGERVGAITADGFSDIMIGGAILPSLLHQDPRYFYQGTGTTASRIRHAMSAPFVARGDNGRWQPNYSSLGGDLAASALANAYYPKADRSAGYMFQDFALGTAERIGASLAQEFLVGRLTRRGGHLK